MALPPVDEEAVVVADETTPLVRPATPSEARVRLTAVKRRVSSYSSNRSVSSISPVTFFACLLMLAIGNTILAFAVFSRIPSSPRHDGGDPRNHLITAHRGAVASDVEVCSQIGVNTLRMRNGTAVDAAIATALCIGVVNMYASGIGGGGFMVVRAPDGTSSSLNFREMAPGASHRDMFNHDPLAAQHGGLAVAIPGEVAGFYAAWKLYGRVPWRELFAPSIALCEDGVRVPMFLRHVMEECEWLLQADKKEWGFLFREDGQMLQEGDVMYRPALGKTLRLIAEGGPEVFYEGSVARSLAKFVKAKGGVLTVGDMKEYTAQVDDTLKVWAFGQEILTCPPPCRTMKWLSAGRTELGDPFDEAVSNVARVAEIQSKQFAAMVRRNISDDRTYGWKHYNPSYEFKESRGTSHMSALDAEGMAVALTTTVNLYFGARICDPETGIVLNDEMDDFSIPGTDNAFRLQPSIYNYIKPFKRPLSSTAPTITVYNGYPSLIIGGSGGSRIVTSVFLSFIKIYKWGYSLLDTIRSPRVHHQLIPEVAYTEAGLRDDIVLGLKDRGHVVEELPVIGSVIQAVHRLPDGEIHAVSDYWRKGGTYARKHSYLSLPLVQALSRVSRRPSRVKSCDDDQFEMQHAVIQGRRHIPKQTDLPS
ncbi:Gamma-glutamyltransferase [Drechslerella dactyloides]|uniref:Glutathione hydrolase n=1 Tax=Drechslerella dactyloides TaxID=74499 RepID=A0AAD6NL06_DREDA|nr:Gamma-glutamyltransferase [Drechslerella dactyloides]